MELTERTVYEIEPDETGMAVAAWSGSDWLVLVRPKPKHGFVVRQPADMITPIRAIGVVRDDIPLTPSVEGIVEGVTETNVNLKMSLAAHQRSLREGSVGLTVRDRFKKS